MQAPGRLTGGGTAFAYNLTVGGQRVTGLRLSDGTLTKIFTGVVTNWADPAIAADNPGLALPSRQIVPVVRSDAAGTTLQFTRWMSVRQPALWNDYCARAGLPAGSCGPMSLYPIVAGTTFTAQARSQGVAGYVSEPN